jgi:hypothetical protein
MTAQLSYHGTHIQTAGQTPAAGHGRLRRAGHRIRTAVAEMNYASRRVVELQAPWIVDEHWHCR